MYNFQQKLNLHIVANPRQDDQAWPGWKLNQTNKSEINKFKIMVQNYEDYELMRRCSEDEIKQVGL